MYRSYSRGHLQAEGAFVLRINELSESNISLADAGSYLVITNWKDPTHKDPTRISLTAFPVSSDRFGSATRSACRGAARPIQARAFVEPGLQAPVRHQEHVHVHRREERRGRDPADGEQKSALAVLAGGGID